MKGMMRMIKTILVPTDGSDHSEKAVGFAADLAEKYGAKVHLLHVLRDPGSANIPPDLRSYARIEHVQVTQREVIREIANEILEKAEHTAREHGAKEVESSIEIGSPAEWILDAARAREADLIVMGTRGLGDFQGLIMGSTAHKVTHLAPCTCITVR